MDFRKVTYLLEEPRSNMFPQTDVAMNRSSQQRVLFKKTVLKTFAILTWKHLCWSLFLIRFYWKRTPTQVFPVNIAKNLRIPILKNTCKWLLLYEGAKIREKYLFLGIWMFLPNLFETEYIWIFSVFKVGIFIEKKIFSLRTQFL